MIVMNTPNVPGLEFHLWKGKVIFVLQRALPLKNLKSMGNFCRGTGPRPPCNTDVHKPFISPHEWNDNFGIWASCFNSDFKNFALFARANYYGEYQGVHVDYDATINQGDAAITLDAELSYFISDNFKLAVGAQNLLDQEATKINFTEQGAADCGGCTNNEWGGVYYETSPFGFNGGFYYVKATYEF